MNTDLLLRVADEIEAHPDLYDQRTGAPPYGAAYTADCPLCVAGNAVRLSEASIDGLRWHGPDGTWARAHVLLRLTSAQACYLFAETPEATNIARAFDLGAGELDGIKHLREWTKAGPGVIKPAHLHPDKPSPTFNEFWTSNQYFDDDEPGPDGEDPHYAEYVMCRAAIMAAALRIIVAGNAANTPRPGTPKAH